MEGVVANDLGFHKGANPKEMELAHFGEQVYQLELQVYWTTSSMNHLVLYSSKLELITKQQHHLWYNLLLLLN